MAAELYAQADRRIGYKVTVGNYDGYAIASVLTTSGGVEITPTSGSQLPASLGPKAGSASLSIVPATDALFATYGARPFGPVTGTLTHAASLASNDNIGGLITIATGLSAGTVIHTGNLRFFVLQANLTTPGNTGVAFFSANPTATTFTDDAPVALNVADLSKVVTWPTVSVTNSNNGGAAYWQTPVPRMAVGTGGNIWVAFNAAATLLFTAPNLLIYSLEGVY